MITRRMLAGVSASVLVAFVGSWSASAGSINDFQAAHPGVSIYAPGGNVSRVYGAPFSTGATPYASAEAFIGEFGTAMGVTMDNLSITLNADGMDIQPMMYDRQSGDWKFVSVKYAQHINGITVDGAFLTVLMRNTGGYPAILASSSLVNLGSFQGPKGGASDPGLLRPSQVGLGGYLAASTTPRLVVWVDRATGENHSPHLAYQYISQTGRPGQPVKTDINGNPTRGTYDRRLVFVDAATGAILHQESLIHTIDVVGNVEGWATPGVLPDMASNPPVLFDLPNFRVEIVGGNFDNTDANGDFQIANGGAGQVTVRSRMIGPSLSQGVFVLDGGGANILVDQLVTPPGPANFTHNVGPTQFNTSQVNAMLQSSIIHTFVTDINPAFPGLSRAFRANVNINSSCNAFYDGASINFYRLAGGCNNTAYTSVIYHEYGHKLVADGGSGQGAYGEGMGDVMGICLLDDPITGRFFFTNGGFVRDARDGRQYPCGGEIHFCGQLLSGCVWDTREALILTEPVNYLNILSDLSVNSILLHNGTTIDPSVTIDYLTLDDNDGNLGNGSPHYNEINAGFTAHNMPAPPLALLNFDYPNGRPNTLDPDGGTTVRVEVSANVEDPQPGTGELHYNAGSGFITIPMQVVSTNVYDAVFPAFTCGDTIDWYVSARTTTNALATDPPNAPADTYSTLAADGVITALDDNFQNDLGWTVQNQNLITGAWIRGVPAGGGQRGDPSQDYDGSGSCYVTGNTNSEDVDGGPTRLLSPLLDLSAGDAIISYARWFTTDDGNDFLVVEVSADNGTTWALVENVANAGEQWRLHEFHASDFITPTATVRVRFTTSDNPNDSVTEAAIDAVKVLIPDCGGLNLSVDATCPGGGPITASWFGATGGGQVGIVMGNSAGSFTIPNNSPCAGTQLGVTGGVQLIFQGNAGANGSRTINSNAGPGLCGKFVQLVDGATCRTSNVVQVN